MFYIDNDNNSTDKYDLSRFIDMDDKGAFDVLNSYFLYQLPKLPAAGSFVVQTEANRPDMLSYKIYGATQYWWVVMWYNHLLQPKDIRNGMTVRYPSLSAIEQLYLQASLNKKVNG